MSKTREEKSLSRTPKSSPQQKSEGAAAPPAPYPRPSAPASYPRPSTLAPDKKPSAAASAVRCQRQVCLAYLKKLNLNPAYFDPKYDKCFCSVCHPTSSNPVWFAAGAIYVAPLKWTRFGLRLDQTFVDENEIFKTWHTTYYATSKGKLSGIIDNRFIPFSGDILLKGEVFETKVLNPLFVYTSPSIDYASLQHTCPVDLFEIDNVWYNVKVMLQCKQNPKGSQKGRGTRKPECTLIPHDEIDWKTDLRSSVVPFGLLIYISEASSSI